jgi:Cytochrome c7 and related cytochrome c
MIMKRRPVNNIEISRHRISKWIVLIFTFFFTGYFLVSCTNNNATVENKVNETTPAPVNTPLVEINPNADFSKFSHSNEKHDQLPCLLCHKREDNSSQLKLPGHLPCSGCHVQQFADNKNAVCTICHTNTETGEMKGFPGLQSHNAVFDHGQHLRVANCADCHKQKKNGVAMTILSRSNSHATCFQCHQPDRQIAEKNIGSCQTCHQKGNPPPPVSESAKAYSTTPFSHAAHRMSCTACHNIKAGAGRGNQVTAIKASMHFPPKNTMSCATCHDNKKVFGGTDFADCKRCHTGGSFKF